MNMFDEMQKIGAFQYGNMKSSKEIAEDRKLKMLVDFVGDYKLSKNLSDFSENFKRVGYVDPRDYKTSQDFEQATIVRNQKVAELESEYAEFLSKLRSLIESYKTFLFATMNAASVDVVRAVESAVTENLDIQENVVFEFEHEDEEF